MDPLNEILAREGFTDDEIRLVISHGINMARNVPELWAQWVGTSGRSDGELMSERFYYGNRLSDKKTRFILKLVHDWDKKWGSSDVSKLDECD